MVTSTQASPPYLCSRYVNDFNLQQRTYRVYVQADAHRSNPVDICIYVRSANNQGIFAD